MLMKVTIVVSDLKGDQFLSSLFLVKKKNVGHCPVVNLKDLMQCITEGCTLCNPPVSQIQEVCLIPVERPSIQLLKVQSHCQEILEKAKSTVRELKLIRLLSSTAIAVLPAPLHYHHFQHQQIQKLTCHNSFEEKVTTSVEARK